MDSFLRSRAEQLAIEIASQAKTAEDLNGLMRLMMKSALERMLNSELDVHLGRRTLASAAAEQSLALALAPIAPSPPPASPTGVPAQRVGSPNRRNGRSRKTVPGELGELTIATPRDRSRHFRAAIDRQAPAARAGLRRKHPRVVCQGNDHA
jgi:putative transposase